MTQDTVYNQLSPPHAGGTGSETLKTLQSVAQETVDELLGVEGSEIVCAFTQPDEFHRNPEFTLHLDDDTALG